MPKAKASIWNPLFARDSVLAELLVESAAEGIWVIALDGKTLYANPAMLRLLGTTAEALLASHAFDFVPIEDRAQARDAFEKQLAGAGGRFDIRLLRTDGQTVFASITSSLLNDESGSPIGLIAYLSDISAQRQAVAAQMQAEYRFRLAVDAAQLGTFNCTYPLEQDIFAWNETLSRQHFVGPDEIPSLALFLSRIHPDDRDHITRNLENAARHHAPYDVEYRILPPPSSPHDNRQPRWIRAIGRHTYDARGNPLRIDGITMDITARKLLEHALREEGRTTHTLCALSKTLVTEFDLETLIHTITEAGTLLTGATLGAFLHRVQEGSGDAYLLYSLSGDPERRFDHMPVPLQTDLFGPAFLGQGPVRIADLRSDPRGGLPHLLCAEDSLIRSFLAVPVISRFGHIIGSLCCGHPDCDRFTERDERTLAGIASHAAIAIDNARLLNEARQANAAKDKFLAVLSHELRTPLTPVLLNAGIMANDMSLPESVRANLETIRRNVELEARLIDDLLDITRIAKGRIDLQPAIVDVHALLQNVVAMFRQDLAAKALRVTVDLAAARHHVRGDSARLQQVWWNLLRNAIKFTAPHGAITIRTRNLAGERHHTDGRVALPAAPLPAAQTLLAVEVTDSGIGMQPDQIDRLFRPFEQGDRSIAQRFGGLGLGLAISRSLMEIHSGSLVAMSEGIDRGATFTATLPAVAGPELRTCGTPVMPGGGTASLDILLVEDHVDTARTMVRLLANLGHRATIAHSIADALHAAGQRHFDLLICDIGLPDGSGLDLLARLPTGAVPAHAVALTGYGMEEDVRRSHAAGFEEHLTKPLNFDRMTALLQRIAAATESPSEPPLTYQI